MERSQILKSDILDIIFDGKNKEYGAYELRRTYNKRIGIAVGFTIALMLLLLIAHAISNNLSTKEDIKPLIVNETNLTKVNPDEPPPPPPPPPPKLPPPPVVQTVQFTPPKVVKDEEVVKPPPEIKQIEESKIDLKTVEGVKDIGIVAPPSDIKGSNVVTAPVQKKEDPDEIFTKVEIDAKFPGGPGAWAKYVTKAISAEIDEFTDEDYGTVNIRFVVDVNGNVSDVQALNMKGSKLAQIAVNAIRKGPNWTPAVQNGRSVKAYRTQPVTLTPPD